MSRLNTENLRSTTIALVVATLACLGVAACGSSSGGSSSSASTATAVKTTAEAKTTTTPESTTPTTTTPASTTPEAAAEALAYRRKLNAAVAKCLRSNGAQVAEPNAEGFLTIEAATLRAPQYHTAVAKCHSVIAEAVAGASKK